jgi:hypothetical protein
MKKKTTPPSLIVDNDKTLLFEVASEYEVLENLIMREQINNGSDSPRMVELRERQSAALKLLLCKLAEKPGIPWAWSCAVLKLLD